MLTAAPLYEGKVITMQATGADIKESERVLSIYGYYRVCANWDSYSHHRIEVGKDCVIEGDQIVLN